MKRFICSALVMALLTGILAGCGTKREPGAAPSPAAPPTAEALASGDYGLRAAVLHSGEGYTWSDTLQYLAQPLLINLEAEGLDDGSIGVLGQYDILYLDASLRDAEDKEAVAAAVMEFTDAGGSVFVSNELYDFFPAEYFGAASFQKVEGYPYELSFPGAGEDLGEIQGIISDFKTLYESFADFGALAQADYGYAMVPDGATPLAVSGGAALYAMNSYGDGLVFFTNPLLPNVFSECNFEMEPRGGEFGAFSSTTASCNQLLLNGFAEYVSKQEYGYAASRVFGYFGSPSMNWELHYEEITGMQHNAMELFSDLCTEYKQIPSFSLVRNTYWWFKRAESVTYLLGGSDGYHMDFYENAYSSGTHIDSDGAWLSLDSIEDAGSYFVDYPEYAYRAYPVVLDYDGDGDADIFCGTVGGGVVYYEGQGFGERLKVSGPQVVCDTNGAPINVGTYSAPQLFDLDGDGYLDLICGSGAGKLTWYAGGGTLEFAPMGELINAEISGQVLPAVGDVNGDGTADLVVGSNQGIMLVYYGQPSGEGVTFSHDSMGSYSKVCANAGLGSWLAPTVADVDGDGKTELAVGAFDGYVAVLTPDDGGSMAFSHYITDDELNYKGNSNVKFGNYCVPAFWDINGDGVTDLICGSLEYGLAYPIDSEYFPYAAELRQQADYAKEHNYYVGLHYYTNSYASTEREKFELEAHKKALEFYGLPTENIGANQHTWYTSTLGGAQSLYNSYQAGLLWNSGFGSPGATWKSPQAAAENVIALPFFLVHEGDETLLVQNNSVLPYTNEAWYALSAKYDMPVCAYYHCDFVYESEDGAREALEALSNFQWTNGYNFCREDQAMLASAASCHLLADISGNLLDGNGLTISPAVDSTEFAMYNEDVQNSLGIRISPAEGLDASNFVTDASVWYVSGGDIYLGLDKQVTLSYSEEAANAGAHLVRVNMAVEIETDASGASVTFLSGGMLQAVVEGRAETSGGGWDVERRGSQTVFTKYGEGERLQIEFLGGWSDE